jgi:sulfoxide reductase heme-binding subunit YedZ
VLPFIPKDRGRRLTHAALALLAAVGCYFTFTLTPGFRPVHSLTIGLGYTSLILIVVTLVIGPLQLLRRKRNPVNINLRRDTGIWAGVTGGLHVVFGFQVHMNGDIVQYFFERTPHHGLRPLPLIDLFGFSNYTGAVATIALILLLFLSNDLSLKWLRGPLWKWLQRLNYALIVLSLAHTVGYQAVVEREEVMTLIVLGLTAATVLAQMAGVAISMRRRAA